MKTLNKRVRFNLKAQFSLFTCALLTIISFGSIAFAQDKPVIKYAQVGEVKLAYYLKGQGEPMILINGYAATMSVWDPALLDELAKKIN